jgi:hypothetical protein
VSYHVALGLSVDVIAGVRGMGSYAGEVGRYLKRAKRLTDSQRLLRYIASYGCVSQPKLVKYIRRYLSYHLHANEFLGSWLRIHIGIVKICTKDNIQYICLNTDDLCEGEV